MLTLGKYMPIICTPDNSIEDDVCPYGYECLRSITDFAQGLSQPNYSNERELTHHRTLETRRANDHQQQAVYWQD
ncbi:unnamed protein product [Gongylonema pulchrum]|uniref:Clip domain-containing protein n=1 Tax=Gongylonema pulchrum TaxID=637853 RepID=A0A183E8B8_9BILA|nr:unnamed protein product [Gongylonema pulchrum]